MNLKIAAASLYFIVSASYSCSTVFWNDNGLAMVVARSTDLYVSDIPKVFVNPRQIEHNGEAGPNSLKWTAKYGTVVITAFNTKAVSDGVNEAGLSAHLLYLSKTKYPEVKPDQPVISNMLWAQYVLDNFKTVNEVLANTKDLQITPTIIEGKTWPIHLAIEDKSGDSAVVEYVDGKLHVYHGKEYRVMTNEPPLDVQLTNLKKYVTFGGTLTIPGYPDPLSRFVRASYYLKTLPKPKNNLEAIAGVFSVIRSVMVPFGAVDFSGNETEDAWATRWITITDLTHNIYYFSSTSTPNLIWIDLQKLNFAPGNTVQMIDPLNLDLVGDITNKISQIN